MNERFFNGLFPVHILIFLIISNDVIVIGILLSMMRYLFGITSINEIFILSMLWVGAVLLGASLLMIKDWNQMLDELDKNKGDIKDD